jgi:hypothetical protein
MTMAELFPDRDGDSAADPLLSGAFEPGLYLVPDSGCPPEYAGVPLRELFAQIDAARQERAARGNGGEPAGGIPNPARRVSAGFWL